MNRDSPPRHPWSTPTAVLFGIVYVAFVFVMTFYLDTVASPGQLPLMACAAFGFVTLWQPLQSAWERRMRVALSSLPQEDRKAVRRAVVAGAAPVDPAQREVAHQVAAEELGLAVRHRALLVIGLAVVAAVVGFLALTGEAKAWAVLVLDVGAVVVRLGWSMWLRRRVALLGPAG